MTDCYFVNRNVLFITQTVFFVPGAHLLMPRSQFLCRPQSAIVITVDRSELIAMWAVKKDVDFVKPVKSDVTYHMLI